VARGWRRGGPEYFWGLREIDLAIEAGTTVGVIGANGAGKSTLLRLLGGIGQPDEGSIKVHGRVSGLLSLGAGFHSDLTGRENVLVTGIIGGLTRAEVEREFDSIVDFAELRDAIDAPLRTYSSGMEMRLAFAVAIHVQSSVLLIDEVLAVGDLAFQRKCLNRILDLKARGVTIVLVSHDAATVATLCEEALWLESGRIVEHGPAPSVVNHYVAMMRARAQQRNEAETLSRTPGDRPPLRTSSGATLEVRRNRFGSLEMELIDVQLLDSYGSPTAEIVPGDCLNVEILYDAPGAIPRPVFGVTITGNGGRVCLDTSTDREDFTLPLIRNRGTISVRFEGLRLPAGLYHVDVGVYQQDWSYAYDYHYNSYPLRMRAEGAGCGAMEAARIIWRHESQDSGSRRLARVR